MGVKEWCSPDVVGANKIYSKEEPGVSSCPYFKNGYFGVCTASESNHVPLIAEMELEEMSPYRKLTIRSIDHLYVNRK